MITALTLAGVLGASLALPKDGFTIEPRQGFTIQPRFPVRYKIPAPVARDMAGCSKTKNTITLAPGESINFASPNYPNDYDSKTQCKYGFKSTEDITITCSDFQLQNSNKKGKCKDKMTIDGYVYCGSQLSTYYGGTSITATFKSNKKKNYKGYYCTATAASSGGGGGSGDCTCGQANRASRIVNGVETEVNEYPWQGAMVYSGSNVFCGASVIGSKHLLTAAHCTQAVTDYGIDYQVLVGAHSLSNPASSQERFNPAKFIQHSGYDDSTYDNDIAIIVLSGEIDFTKSQVRPVCLPDSDSNTYDSVTATVSGWGALESGGGSPDVLMEVDVPTMSNTACSNSYQGAITANMLCAGYEEGGKDSCQGDSGGPLIYNSGSGYTQIGVVSWGYGCAAAGYPGVYARVTRYLSWISSNSASSSTCSAA